MLLHFVQYWPPPPAPPAAHLCSGLCHQLVGRTASNFDQLQSALMINSHNFLLSPALHLRRHMVSPQQQEQGRCRSVGARGSGTRLNAGTGTQGTGTRHRHTGHGTARHGGRAAGGGSLVLPPVLFPPLECGALPFCSSSPTTSFMWQPTTPMYCWCPRPGRQLRHRPIRHFLLHSVGSRRNSSQGFMEFIEFKEVYGVFLGFMAG